MPLFSAQFHNKIYIIALVLLVVSLPFSIFTLSVAQIILMANWILEGKFQQKLALVKGRPSLWTIALFYIVHLLWMANTSDTAWGMHDLRIKLPMLVIPLVIGTSDTINENKLKSILNFYIVAVLAASLISAFSIFGFDHKLMHRVSDYSLYVSHITWSIMVVIAIFIILRQFDKTSVRYRWLFVPVCLWFVIYLFLLQVLTGIVIFIITIPILLFWTIFQYHNLIFRWFMVVIILTIVLVTTNYLIHSYATFHTFDKIDASTLENYTTIGNRYYHDTKSKIVENGHYVNIYICEPELEKSWNLRSKLRYSGNTLNGEELKRTLTRYLTSKGLRKDSAGMNQLTDSEIKFIEWGKTNYIDTLKYNLNSRIYVTWWELYNYKNGVSPSGYSVAQRIESLKTAFQIIHKNFWLGVGTGDIPDAFAEQYVINNSSLPIKNRIRTHNQYVTFIVTFGIIGFIFVMFSLITPPFFEKKFSNYLFFVIFIIGMLSFVNEDTLETHQGISLFAFFYFLFLFSAPPFKTDHHVEI